MGNDFRNNIFGKIVKIFVVCEGLYCSTIFIFNFFTG